MKPFLYLQKCNFINFIKSLRHKPTKLIPILFYLAFMIFFAVSFSIDPPGSENLKDPRILITIFTIVGILSSLLTVYSGISRERFNYYMSDVNLIFTSPIKPQNVLLYGFIRQISSALMIVVFLVFQIPMLITNFNFVTNGLPILLLTLFLLFVTLSFVSLLMYGIFSKYTKYKNLASNISKYTSVAIVGALGLYIYSLSGNILDNILNIFSNDYLNYIPIIGWTRALLVQCLSGFNSSTILYIGLLVITNMIFIIVLYNFNLDFYEDVLSSAEMNEVAQTYKNSGYDMKQLDNTKLKYKPWSRKGVKSNYSSLYAKAIFSKHMLEHKKTGLWFFNILSLIYLLISISFGLFIKDLPFSVLLMFSVYIMAVSTYAGKWSSELNGHYIYLIPASSESKLFFSTLSTLIKYLSDSLILFIPAGILTGANPLEIVFSILAYMSFATILTYGAVLNYKLFDKVSNQMVKGMFMMLSLFLFILPGVVVGLLLSFKFQIFGPYALHFSFIAYNLVASIIIIQFAKGIFDTIES